MTSRGLFVHVCPTHRSGQGIQQSISMPANYFIEIDKTKQTEIHIDVSEHKPIRKTDNPMLPVSLFFDSSDMVDKV